MLEKIFTIIMLTISGPIFVFLSIIFFIVSIVSRKTVFPYVKILARIQTLLMGIWVTKTGNFPKEGQFIVMANHSSMLDPLLVPFFMKGEYTGIAAKSNYKYPIWAQILKRFKAIKIERFDHQQAIQTIQYAERILKKYRLHIIILPEGGRTADGKMKPLKKGGFHMAMNTDSPILPVGIEGAFSIKPYNRWTFRPGRVTIRIGDVILPKLYPQVGIDGLIKIVDKKLKILSGEREIL